MGKIVLMRQKERRDTETNLVAFGKSCLTLCEILREEQELTEEQRLFIDNHIQLVHLHYARWRSKKSRG
jgi:hypothetical protein